MDSKTRDDLLDLFRSKFNRAMKYLSLIHI